MEAKFLQLHFSQLQSEWATAKYNNYSDLRKREYHNNLSKIIGFLESEDFSKFSPLEIKQRYYVVFFVFKSLEFLNNSTSSSMPFEIVAVLEEALNEWIPTRDYIIVTSLINNNFGFSYDTSLMLLDFIYKEIDILYNIKFEKRLIQINVPNSTSRDYLASVVLYHELGHFIDRKFEISRVLYIEILTAIVSGKLSSDEMADIVKYFPYLSNVNLAKWFLSNYFQGNKFENHIAEYLCDLFGSQYIKECSNAYVLYLTCDQAIDSATHPSSINRSSFVEDFLTGNKKYLIEKYKQTIYLITKQEVKLRTESFKSEDFENFLPVDIERPQQLHFLFVYGWSVWLSDWSKIKSFNRLSFDLPQDKVYAIINGLIEKSIGNFIVRSEWEKQASIIK